MSSVKPLILFLTCHLPWPATSGGRRREYELLKRISTDYDIHLCVISREEEGERESLEVLRRLCRDVRVFRGAPLDRSTLWQEYPRQVLRNSSAAAAAYVAAAVASGRVDLIHVEGFFLMQHVPAECRVPVLLTEQNIEYTLWKQRAACAASEAEREACLQQYLLTKQAETETWRRSSLCVALTAHDKRYIKECLPAKAVRLVPDGVNHLPTLEAEREAAVPVAVAGRMLLFVGNFDYQPNVDAAYHLCRDILPLVRRAVPDAQFFLVGNDPSAELRPLAGTPGVHITGRVPSLMPYLKAADVFVCPLRVGGGVKVKMLEALYCHKAIVGSTVSTQGLPTLNGKGICVADDPVHFAEQVIRLLEDAEAKARVEEAAASIVKLLPTWDDTARELARCYDDLLSERAGLEEEAGAR